nr:MAG TPA: hypothetical protein [Caudoviricetes sp.]
MNSFFSLMFYISHLFILHFLYIQRYFSPLCYF